MNIELDFQWYHHATVLAIVLVAVVNGDYANMAQIAGGIIGTGVAMYAFVILGMVLKQLVFPPTTHSKH